MWQASYENGTNTNRFYQMPPDQKLSIYLPRILPRHDPVSYFDGCEHLTLKIFGFLDSSAILACSLVCQEWQQFVFQHFFGKSRIHLESSTCIRLELKKTLSRIIDVSFDDSFNLMILTLVSGTPHVMFTSMFTKVT